VRIGEPQASEGEAAHLGWMIAHSARARRRVRAARVLISPEAAGAPIYSYFGGGHISLRLIRTHLEGTTTSFLEEL
jgi:hypothetical protein